MLTTEATPEMVGEWRRLFDRHHASMQPNRKSGAEVDRYFRETYPYQAMENAEFENVVAANILENAYTREKLPEGILPDIRCYRVDDVLVGIDLISGTFHVESEEMGKAAPIYDDLFVYRGLDKEDLKNFFLVGEYVKLTHME